MNRVGRGIGIPLLVSTSFLIALEPAGAADKTVASAPGSGVSARAAGGIWSPPDIDQGKPPVTPGIRCSLPAVLEGAGKRTEELTRDLGRFTATELLQHQDVDRRGRLREPENRRFDYMVSIHKVRNGYLDVEELRNRNFSLDMFPHRLATLGTPALVLIFHPRYIHDFEMYCEGLGDWRGQPAWLVHFEQRKDQPNHVRSYRVNGNAYRIRLRGRAWIDARTYQVVRLETDIADQVAEIKLRLEHMLIEYGPVAFPGRQEELWLPQDVELYTDFRGHRFYRRHHFTNFELFSVETRQEITRIKVP